MSAEAKLKELGIELREVPTGDRPLVPAVLYAIWYLGWASDDPTQFSFDNLATAPAFVLDGYVLSAPSIGTSTRCWRKVPLITPSHSGSPVSSSLNTNSTLPIDFPVESTTSSPMRSLIVV